MKPKILFLYSEVADYFLSGVRLLSEQADVMVIRWDVNQDAPFKLEVSGNFQMYEKSSFSGGYPEMKNKVKEFNPDLVICSGWMDKEYLKLARKLKKSKRIVSFDNHWTGHWKQKLATKVARKSLLSPFYKAWVPGIPQMKFAQKLGFKEAEVEAGFYCANTKMFIGEYDAIRKAKLKTGLPKRFLYVGRYAREKGIFDLWKAFVSLSEKYPDWELWCVGTGPEFENRIEHEKIRHFGFLQPNELKDVVEQTGVFVLPSTFEPWGVVVHEYAVSGFPMILSDKVGAASQFLKLKRNGYLFEAGSAVSLKKCMIKYIKLSEEEKKNFSKSSYKIGISYKTEDWVAKVLSFL